MDWDEGPFIFRINENGSGPNLLLQVCLERGWREHSECGTLRDSWNLWWRTSGFPMSHYKQLKAWQYTNHIPKGSSICRKDHLARYLRCMKKIYGSIFDFSPPCYHLPLEYTKLLAECSRGRGAAELGQEHEDLVWICKPVGQSQGRGIFLFRELSELNYASSAVVQRYITNPLLIGGYKFDLRLYACIPSFRPLCVYLYREGLVRFSTDKFTLSDLGNVFRHLTNSSLNRLGPGYTRQKERIGAGCKWSLKQLRHYLHQAGEHDWLLWQRIASLVALTLLAQNASAPPPAAPNCFEFYGFDVLVDATLRPWLLEVNLSPALCSDCDVDATVKKPMLHDMFDLLGLPVSHTGLSLFASWQPHEDSSSEPEDSSTSGTSNASRDDGRSNAPITGFSSTANRWMRRKPRGRPRNQPQKGGNTTSRPSSSRGSRTQRLQRVRSESLLAGEDEGESSCGAGLRWTKEETVSRPPRWTRHHVPTMTSNLTTNSSVWGNGRDWSDSPAKDGDWIRVMPIGFSTTKKRLHGVYDPAGDVKAAVAEVHRFSKAARDAARLVETQRTGSGSGRGGTGSGGGISAGDDQEYNEALEQILGEDFHGEIWLPHK